MNKDFFYHFCISYLDISIKITNENLPEIEVVLKIFYELCVKGEIVFVQHF